MNNSTYNINQVVIKGRLFGTPSFFKYEEREYVYMKFIAENVKEDNQATNSEKKYISNLFITVRFSFPQHVVLFKQQRLKEGDYLTLMGRLISRKRNNNTGEEKSRLSYEIHVTTLFPVF